MHPAILSFLRLRPRLPPDVKKLFKRSRAKYKVARDGSITVLGDLDISNKGLTRLPDLTRVTVTGRFDCRDNWLISLEGGPRNVGGDYLCSENRLKTLRGAPAAIKKTFSCSNNPLKTLEGAPATVGLDFFCSSAGLESLKGGPAYVGGNYDCSMNMLTSLEGAPREVGENFNCRCNLLETLRGGPERVRDVFNCLFNTFLKTLDGAPQCRLVDHDPGALPAFRPAPPPPVLPETPRRATAPRFRLKISGVAP